MNLYKNISLAALLSFTTLLTNAQDTARKSAVVSPTAAKTTAQKSTAATAKPAATPVKPVVSGIPINPKTGKPYGKWGYGKYAKDYQTQKTDSTKKAATAATAPAPAQTPAEPVQPVAVDKSLNGQYQVLLTKVYNYQQPFLAAFWKNVRDSLNQGRRDLKAVNDKLAASNQSIAQLQSTATSHDEELSKADSVDLAGISFSKNGYSAMMWSLVAVLGGLAAIVIFRSGSARSEAAYRTKLYADLEEEFKTYKAKANEKEKKLARELQTERNRVDELLGR